MQLLKKQLIYMNFLESAYALNACWTALQRMIFHRYDHLFFKSVYSSTVYQYQYSTSDVSTCIEYEL